MSMSGRRCPFDGTSHAQSYRYPVIRFCASRTYAKTLARNSEHSANNSKSKASLEHITNDNIQKEKTHGTLENAVKISK